MYVGLSVQQISVEADVNLLNLRNLCCCSLIRIIEKNFE